jgi:hypothetical protein
MPTGQTYTIFPKDENLLFVVVTEFVSISVSVCCCSHRHQVQEIVMEWTALREDCADETRFPPNFPSLRPRDSS